MLQLYDSARDENLLQSDAICSALQLIISGRHRIDSARIASICHRTRWPVRRHESQIAAADAAGAGPS